MALESAAGGSGDVKRRRVEGVGDGGREAAASNEDVMVVDPLEALPDDGLPAAAAPVAISAAAAEEGVMVVDPLEALPDDGLPAAAAPMAAAVAAAEDHVRSDPMVVLPDDAVLRIISFLPLKSAIRTTALSKAWQRLWMEDWGHKSRRYEIRARRAPSVEDLLKILEEERRLERLSVVVHTIMKSSHLRKIIERSADRHVEELHVELTNLNVAEKVRFHLPILSRVIAHLSLRHVVVSKMRFTDQQRFNELSTICFHFVAIESYIFRKVITRCPNLRVLDLRSCAFLDAVVIPPGGPKLNSLTIAGCKSLKRVDVVSVTSLRSVFYSGRFLSSFYLPRTSRCSSFTDLYICYDNGPIIPKVFGKWAQGALPKLSNLSNLTICSNALMIVSSLPDEERTTQLDWLDGFQRLTELQLLMFDIKTRNVADIYAFLQSFHFPNLTNLFLQLPRIREDVQEAVNEDVLQLMSERVPAYVLDNLKVVRMMNFNRTSIEIHLVRFFLRKARNINSLQLVSLSHNAIPLGMVVQQGDIIQGALANGVIQESNSAAGTTQPCHSEVFIEF
uniref:F-box domain-containing protein n=1 Tax=Oryza punctata TaxID=4537 RepID=A0A0E0LEV0_ORYPU